MEKQENIELVLSPSRINTYKKCPRKYYYTYIEKLPRKDWAHFALGTLVHGALEKFHQEFRDDFSTPGNIEEAMKIAFKAQYVEMEKEKPIERDTLKEAHKLLKEYLINIKQQGIQSKILLIEEDFTLKLNEHYNIRGVIDRLDLDSDGQFHIKDYKTTKSDKYMEPFQLQVYGIYLLDKFPDVDRFRGSYVMLRLNNMYVSYDFNREDVEKCWSALIEVGDTITKEERWISRPSKLCDWCDFADPCLTAW